MAAKPVLTVDDASGCQRDSGSIPLSSFTTIEAAAARVLAETDYRWLCLDGLTDLSEEAAQALSAFRGQTLTFGGLTSLSDRSAKALSMFRGSLVVLGLRELSNSAAKSLSAAPGAVFLNGLRRLSVAAAAALSQHPQVCLEVNGKSDADLPDEAIAVLKSAETRENRLIMRQREWAGDNRRRVRFGPCRWLPPLPRRNYQVQNDDATIWSVCSAVFEAVDGKRDEAAVKQGWCFDISVGECLGGFRVLLDEPLTRAERSKTMASGIWPLIRVPDGVLLIGECITGLSNLGILEDDRWCVELSSHDRTAAVLVPNGCYEVVVHQYGGGESYLFELRSLGVTCNWESRAESLSSDHLPRCPAYLPLDLRADLPPSFRVVGEQSDPKRSNIGSWPGEHSGILGRDVSSPAAPVVDADDVPASKHPLPPL